jgi:hypothetical protein
MSEEIQQMYEGMASRFVVEKNKWLVDNAIRKVDPKELGAGMFLSLSCSFFITLITHH